MRKSLVALALAAFSLTLGASSVRAEDGPDWLSDPNTLPKGVVSNDNVMLSKDSSAMSLLMQADRALKSDKIDRAIDLIKRSLELNNEDLDAHMSYANALERKLRTQEVEDPQVFNQCVKEWLAVLRNKYGEEKNETIDGIGLPGFNGRFYADDERQTPARNHLVKLTGSAPKPWETNTRFLARVSRHGEAEVSGKMVHHDANATDKPAGSSDEAVDGAKTKNRAAQTVGKDPYPDTAAPVGKSSARQGAGTQ